LFDQSIYEIAGDDRDLLSYSKIVVTVMMVGLGNIVFVRQLKLIWQNQKLNVKKISLREARISLQALVVGRSYSVQYKGICGMPDKGQTLYV
jgi:hypothetical protein